MCTPCRALLKGRQEEDAKGEDDDEEEKKVKREKETPKSSSAMEFSDTSYVVVPTKERFENIHPCFSVSFKRKQYFLNKFRPFFQARSTKDNVHVLFI